MKRILKLIILTLQQKGIITYPEMVEMLDQANATTTTDLRRDRRKKEGKKGNQANVQRRSVQR